MGYFTWHLIQGLKGDAEGAGTTGEVNGRLTARELIDFVRPGVSGVIPDGKKQEPELLGPPADEVIVYRPWQAASKTSVMTMIVEPEGERDALLAEYRK